MTPAEPGSGIDATLPQMTEHKRIDAYLICNARFHDTNSARLELLKLLAEHENIMVRVAEDYSDVEAINQAQLLLTYTCDLCPTPEQQEGLKRFLTSGNKWFALHATNALIDFVGGIVEVDNIRLPGKADTPDKAPALMDMLGSRFVSPPPIQPITVAVSDPEHPLVQGIEPFEVVDEPYYCEYYGEIHTLLESRYTDKAVGYVREEPPEDAPRPQFYLHPYGAGAALYLTLGHCRGKYDMQPFMEVCSVERCAWESPVYYELLRRGIRWGMGELGR